MTDSSEKGNAFRSLVAAAAVVVVVAGMRAAQPIVVPFLMAAFIAIICWPPLKWLEEKRVPSVLALLIVISVITIVGVVVVGLIGTSVNDFLQKTPEYGTRLTEKKELIVAWLEEKDLPVSDLLEQRGFDPKRVMQIFANILGGLGSLFSDALLILVILAFMLLEASGFPVKLRAIAGAGRQTGGGPKKIVADVRHYVAIKTAVSILTGAIVVSWLTLLGVDYPLLWGLLAFFFNFVPNIGSFIAAIPAVLLAFIQIDAATALYAALGYVVVNGILGNVVEPRVMGRGLGLSTLVVFLSLLFWGWVLGPVGMLLSVPLTMIAKIVMESSDDTRWIAILLGSEAAAEECLQAQRDVAAEDAPARS